MIDELLDAIEAHDAYILYSGNVEDGVLSIAGVTTSLEAAETWGASLPNRFYQKIESLIDFFLSTYDEDELNGIQ